MLYHHTVCYAVEDMKAYMKHSPRIYFEFTPTVFLLNFTISLLLGLVMTLYRWEAGVATAPPVFLLLYTVQGKPPLPFSSRSHANNHAALIMSVLGQHYKHWGLSAFRCVHCIRCVRCACCVRCVRCVCCVRCIHCMRCVCCIRCVRCVRVSVSLS